MKITKFVMVKKKNNNNEAYVKQRINIGVNKVKYKDVNTEIKLTKFKNY